MSEVQAILFDRNYWLPSEAEGWINLHNYRPIKAMHTSKNYYRFRIQNPDKFKRLRTLKIGNYISFIVGFR